MAQRLRRQLSFANVTSCMALVFALGGTSFAAMALPRNSVGGKQVKKGAVRGSDIRANAVTGGKVKDGSLMAGDFNAGQLPKGDQGEKGDQGDTGAFGAATVRFLQAPVDLADNTSGSYTVFCPAGQQAIAGGARGDATSSIETSVTSSRPAISAANTEPPLNGQSFTGWRITVLNPTGGAPTGIRPEVWVVCVPAP